MNISCIYHHVIVSILNRSYQARIANNFCYSFMIVGNVFIFTYPMQINCRVFRIAPQLINHHMRIKNLSRRKVHDNVIYSIF